MFKFGLFGKNTDAKAETNDQQIVIAQLNARVQPMDRGDYFEDPLDEVLRSADLGEVTGGGTQLAGDPDGIAYCDLEIAINDETDATILKITRTLEELGAPKGSFLKFSSDRADVPFGQAEGMGIFLNGTDLPDEVYANSDVNETIGHLEKLLESIGSFRGYWEGSSETALYFYGGDFELMKKAAAQFLEEDPLCAKSRIVQIA
ncbi:hypothetical protein [Ruegeria atlantica]|uniref:hypothetical protein n=1 Tax=Ruegeria atlantica TaxID=81569 RepID=UPI001480340B|nr:hypothetical protein [Ruegeria atlantica]